MNEESRTGTCAQCGQPRTPSGHYCFNCGHAFSRPDAATGPNETNVRLPRVVVPDESDPLDGVISGSAAPEQAPPARDAGADRGADRGAAQSGAPTQGHHDATWIPYGEGPRFPLYADEPSSASAPTTFGQPAAGPAPRQAPPSAARSAPLAVPPAPQRAPGRSGVSALPLLVVALAVLLVAATIGGAAILRGGSDSEAGSTDAGDAGNEGTGGGADDSDDSDDSDDPDDVKSHPPEVEVPDPRPLADLATPTASSTGAPGTSLAGDEVTYEVSNVLDGDPATTWRVEGDGSGETLTFTFGEEVAITSLGLVNGYAKVDEHDGETVDWYERNRVVTEVRWTFDDGSVFEQDFRRDPSPQTAEVPATVTRSVELEIVAVSGHNGADRTPISEVLIDGAPAAEATGSTGSTG